ncbi:MAG: hypothetical protein HY784_17190 [Chloroflexi bacterium]|nr:hypothetical protein [Chloroflexota bacterium]
MKRLLISLMLFALLLPLAAPARAASTGGPHLTPDTSPPDTSPPDTSPALPRWQQLFPASSPPARSEPGLAYDSARRVAVLFGGYDGDARDDTWEWESEQGTWVQRFPAHRPPARFGGVMAYDEARGVTVMFGGVNDYYIGYSDTWLWDGMEWTQVFPASAPEPRWLHSMVYDSRRGVVVLFGGDADNFGPMWDTWEWDGSNWVEQEIAHPRDRYGMALAYDSRRRVTVLFGGDEGYGWDCFNDTWERAGGGDWVEVVRRRHPEDRKRLSSAYFPRLRGMVIYGGITCDGRRLSDTWVWVSGRTWVAYSREPHPTGGGGGMVYDSLLGGLLLYVGVSQQGYLISDTWLLR